jgi:dTDP-4-dehydrorhamnose reductase
VSGETVLVIGREGQVATALARLDSPFVYRCCPRTEADLTVTATLEAAIARHRPAVVVNAGAYNGVDRAEQEPAVAFAVNAEGPGRLAELCRAGGIPLVHLSSDYVFDGRGSEPYRVDHPVAPLGVYGRSKAAGEEAVRTAFGEHVIVRTAWVFSEGGQNFLTTMLRLARERAELAIVNDQTGSPTYASDLAGAVDRIVGRIFDAQAQTPWGTCHVANAGMTTWYGLACEIFRAGAEVGLPAPRVTPITTADYPTPARRPAYSVLDTSVAAERFGIAMPAWQDAVGRCIANVVQARSVDA